MNGTILVVDDEPQVRAAVVRLLHETRLEVLQADGCRAATRLLESEQVDYVLVDVYLKDGSGYEVIEIATRLERRPGVVLMSGNATLANAVDAVRLRADDFLLKPFSVDELTAALGRCGARQRRATPKAPSPSGPLDPLTSWRVRYASDILGEDPLLLRVFDVVRRVADTDCSVLITGATGTGKELVARALHRASARADRPFVTVNCAAIPDNLLESELFGHVRGAFTGATGARVGRFVAADSGTLFLDEIGELPLALQAKLLRAVQTKEVVPLGENRSRHVDVRVVAATHRDLDAMVAAGAFREDLLYRVQVVPIEVPALKDRRGDIAGLVEHFLRQANVRRGRAVGGVSAEALRILCAYDWPGNIRQLENTVERMVLLRGDGILQLEDLPEKLRKTAPVRQARDRAVLPEEGIDLRDAVEQFENALILQALQRTGWNKNRAAAVLRMNRTTLVEKLKKKNLVGDAHETRVGWPLPAAASG